LKKIILLLLISCALFAKNTKSNFFLNFITTLKGTEYYINNIVKNPSICKKISTGYICNDKDVYLNKLKISKLKLKINLTNKKLLNVVNINAQNVVSLNYKIKKVKMNVIDNNKYFTFDKFESKHFFFDTLNGVITNNINNTYDTYLKISGKSKNIETLYLDSYFRVIKDDLLVKDLYIKAFVGKNGKELEKEEFLKLIKKYYNVSVYNNEYVSLYIKNKHNRSLINLFSFILNQTMNLSPNKEKNLLFKEFIVKKTRGN